MATPAMPHPHLIVLRSAVTVVLSCLIGQAGWAAAFLGGEGARYRVAHAVGAGVTVVAVVITAVLMLVLRRSAGPVNLALSLLLVPVVLAQWWLGESEAKPSAHIFIGVLLTMLATALTSWTYRHRLPAGTASSAASD